MSSRSNIASANRAGIRTGTRRVAIAPVTIIVVKCSPVKPTRVPLSNAQWTMLDHAQRWFPNPLEPAGAKLATAKRLELVGCLRADKKHKGTYHLTKFGRTQLAVQS
jgi:hypothetical protein